jgi:hypothetical protein
VTGALGTRHVPPKIQSTTFHALTKKATDRTLTNTFYNELQHTRSSAIITDDEASVYGYNANTKPNLHEGVKITTKTRKSATQQIEFEDYARVFSS